MTAIFVINESTEVSDSDASLMTRACATQVHYHAAPWWGKSPVPVTFLPSSAKSSIPPGAWAIALLDDPDQADALGWHTEDQGDVIYGRVFARPILDNKGGVLSGEYSVSATLSHEILETLVDPHCNGWMQNAQDGSMWAMEVCDPVESDSYEIGGVAVSNFVTPHFFDADAAKGERLDILKKAVSPFGLDAGGYAVILQPGQRQPTQVFGKEYPQWKIATKQADTSRTSRRFPTV